MRYTLLLLLFLAAGCDKEQVLPRDPALEIRAKVVFMEDDHKTPRAALPLSEFRLAFPLIAGDLYGSANAEDFIRPKVNADYTLAFDLNESRASIERAVKTGSVGGKLKVQPESTRFGRVAAFTMEPGSERRAGYTVWMDAADSRGLILAYFDRPCSAIGTLVEEGYELRFNIVVPKAGFVWLRRMTISDTISETTVSAPPSGLRLSIAPLKDGQ